VLAACPGFTADCLETLEEIGVEGAEQFAEGGGEVFQLAACLNSQPAWLDTMAAIYTESYFLRNYAAHVIKKPVICHILQLCSLAHLRIPVQSKSGT
jgi:hypothetical protein